MSDVRPSKKQRELLSFIDGFIKGHGYGPSYREVMRALNYKSVSTVAVHIDELITKGYLRKRERSARSLEVIGREESFHQAASAAKGQEKWLLDKVQSYFKKAEQKNSQKLIDDLFVLVGALHILGLEEDYKTYKNQLLALQKQQAKQLNNH